MPDAIPTPTQAELDEAVEQVVTALGERPPEAFAEVFNRLRPADGSVPSFGSIFALKRRDEASAYLDAVRRALASGFFPRLVGELGAAGAAPGLPAAVAAIGPSATLVGEHQAMFGDEGLKDTAWADLIAAVSPRTAIIRDSGDGKLLGTGFLVGHDLLLTAAHVIWPFVDYDADPPIERENSHQRIKIEFHEPPLGDRRGHYRVVGVVERWLMRTSRPCGTPPDLDLADDQLAKSNLDFALLRLDEPIGDEVEFLDIALTVEPYPSKGMAIVGYPGGTACKFHIHRLDQFEKASHRLTHKVNTDFGMSGGPLLTMSGEVLGVHEGAAKQNQVFVYNRGVYIKAIREEIQKVQPDPLNAATGWLTWLPPEQSRQLLAELSLSNFNGRRRHPVFGRTDFQGWVSAAKDPEHAQRVALISGEDGGGKSFTGYLLQAKLLTSPDAVAHLRPEVTRAATTETLFTRLMEAVFEKAERAIATTGARPAAGLRRYDTIPSGLDALETALRDRRSASTKLWLFVDFGRDEGWSASDVGLWTEFITQATQRSWLRLILAGLSRERQPEIRRLLPAGLNPFLDHAEPVDANTLVAFVERQIGARVSDAEATQILDSLRATWTAGQPAADRKLLNGNAAMTVMRVNAGAARYQ